MTKTEIYENTLKQLAESGNEAAKLALSLGASTCDRTVNVQNVMTSLRRAISYNAEAIRRNGIEWSHSTDSSIKASTDEILAAIQLLC